MMCMNHHVMEFSALFLFLIQSMSHTMNGLLVILDEMR